jgi:hypothetical protein
MGRRKHSTRLREIGTGTPTVNRLRDGQRRQGLDIPWRQIFGLLGLGLGGGLLIGVAVGWLLPLQDVRVGLNSLHPDYEADYAVMVGAAYALDGDWDLAQARLGRLAEPDPAAYVVSVAERYIAEGHSPNDIRNLVRLAARFGYTTSAMQPYLPPTP